MLAFSFVPFLSLLACGPDTEVLQENENLKKQVVELKQGKARFEREADKLHAKVRKLQEELKTTKTKMTYDKLGIEVGQSITATLNTSEGSIECELWPDRAPETVLNFVQLSEGTRSWTHPKTKEKMKTPLYAGTIFHRVIPKFMIQGGDPMGTGRGGPGYKFADETSADDAFDAPGLLAMANSGPNTNGSQFFITDRAQPKHLNGKHTIFGKCDNLDVVENIANVPTARQNRPVDDVVLKEIRIVRGEG